MAGVNKQVPLEDAITEAKWTLGISETTIHDIELGVLAQRCLINLGNLNSTYVTTYKPNSQLLNTLRVTL